MAEAICSTEGIEHRGEKVAPTLVPNSPGGSRCRAAEAGAGQELWEEDPSDSQHGPPAILQLSLLVPAARASI